LTHKEKKEMKKKQKMEAGQFFSNFFVVVLDYFVNLTFRSPTLISINGTLDQGSVKIKVLSFELLTK
jgi:hypothetical protein